jgi:hypothetical protein
MKNISGMMKRNSLFSEDGRLSKAITLSTINIANIKGVILISTPPT